MVDVEQLGRGDYPGQVTPRDGRNLGRRAGGYEYVPGRIGLARGALHGVGVEQFGPFGYAGDEFVFQQKLDAGGELGHHLVFAGYDTCHIYGRSRRPDTHRLAVGNGVGHLGAATEAFGGDTPLLQTGASDPALFKQGDAQSLLGGI